MPTVRTIQADVSETVEITWTKHLGPAKYEQLFERHTVPPAHVWDARVKAPTTATGWEETALVFNRSWWRPVKWHDTWVPPRSIRYVVVHGHYVPPFLILPKELRLLQLVKTC